MHVTLNSITIVSCITIQKIKRHLPVYAVKAYMIKFFSISFHKFVTICHEHVNIVHKSIIIISYKFSISDLDGVHKARPALAPRAHRTTRSASAPTALRAPRPTHLAEATPQGHRSVAGPRV